jgi:hypothetical protein
VWQGRNHPDAVALFQACVNLGLWLHCTPLRDFELLEEFRAFGDILLFTANGCERLERATGSRESWREGRGLFLTSSGTGGERKVSRLSLRMCEANARTAISLLGLNSETTVVVSSAFEHTAGWNTLLIPALMAGSPVQLLEHFEAHEVLGGCKKPRAQYFIFHRCKRSY